MKDNKKFTIHITINGIRIPLEIPFEQESIYRDAEKIVSGYIESFRAEINPSSMEELMTLVALQLAVIITKEQAFENINPLVETIERVNEKIIEAI